MAGGVGDVRKLFIFSTTENYFGLVSEPLDQTLLYNSPEINNFLDDGNQMLLRVQRSDTGISFSNTVRFPAPLPWAPFTSLVSARGMSGLCTAFFIRSSSGAKGCLRLKLYCSPPSACSFQACIPLDQRWLPVHTPEENNYISSSFFSLKTKNKQPPPN